MGFLLDRSLADFKYDLYYNDMLLERYNTLASAMEVAERKAKNNIEKLAVTKACVSDWYLGFPLDKKEKTIAFYSPEGVDEATQNKFRFVEGPFIDENEANLALLKINGESLRKA